MMSGWIGTENENKRKSPSGGTLSVLMAATLVKRLNLFSHYFVLLSTKVILLSAHL